MTLYELDMVFKTYPFARKWLILYPLNASCDAPDLEKSTLSRVFCFCGHAYVQYPQTIPEYPPPTVVPPPGFIHTLSPLCLK